MGCKDFFDILVIIGACLASYAWAIVAFLGVIITSIFSLFEKEGQNES